VARVTRLGDRRGSREVEVRVVLGVELDLRVGGHCCGGEKRLLFTLRKCGRSVVRWWRKVECQVKASDISPACTRKIVWMSLVLKLVGEERPNRIGRRAI
jgi:hypothetical protein